MLGENISVDVKIRESKAQHPASTANSLVSAVLSKGAWESLISKSGASDYTPTKGEWAIAGWQSALSSARKGRNKRNATALYIAGKLLAYEALEQSGQDIAVPILPTHATETVTPDAENFARKHRLYGALVLAREIVHEQMRSVMTAVHISRQDDPDAAEFSTICFAITTSKSVDLVLERDAVLQEAFISRLPPNALEHFTIDYNFD